jgi:hypothetical protein
MADRTYSVLRLDTTTMSRTPTPIPEEYINHRTGRNTVARHLGEGPSGVVRVPSELASNQQDLSEVDPQLYLPDKARALRSSLANETSGNDGLYCHPTNRDVPVHRLIGGATLITDNQASSSPSRCYTAQMRNMVGQNMITQPLSAKYPEPRSVGQSQIAQGQSFMDSQPKSGAPRCSLPPAVEHPWPALVVRQGLGSRTQIQLSRPSVKHLTCWWWHQKGQCRYSDSECLYAHHDTGVVADAPRQVKPGGTYIAIWQPKTSMTWAFSPWS